MKITHKLDYVAEHACSTLDVLLLTVLLLTVPRQYICCEVLLNNGFNFNTAVHKFKYLSCHFMTKSCSLGLQSNIAY